MAGPAVAQNAITPAPPANQTDVGPPQLRDFSLNGTVTRPAERPPATQPPRPSPSAPAARPSSTTALPPTRAPASTASPQPAPRSVTVDLPPPSPLPDLPAAVDAPSAQATEQPVLDGVVPSPTPSAPDQRSLVPWLLAALLLGAAGAYYVLRVRPRALAAAGDSLPFELAPPADPAPEPRPVAKPSGGGVVSTGLRPWLDMEFVPERAVVDEQQVGIELVVVLYNSGSAPARDVILEARLFNAGRSQDQQLAAYFANPLGGGERIPLIAPLQRMVVRSAVTLPRTEVQPLLADGRPLLVPLVAFNALYRWGSNGSGQTSASYLVGKQTGSEKLAPFRLDLGPRVFRGLAAREHQLRVRR